MCATSELITRYLVPRLRHQLAGPDAPPVQPTTQPSLDDPVVRQSLEALRQMIEIGKSNDARVIVAQHIEIAEMNGQFFPAHDLIGEVARQAGAEVVQLAPAFEAAMRAGRNPWRDIIHPNAIGQRAIADALLPVLLSPQGVIETQPATGPSLDTMPVSR
jgi:lysophospholipase L1-like esterase